MNICFVMADGYAGAGARSSWSSPSRRAWWALSDHRPRAVSAPSPLQRPSEGESVEALVACMQ